MTLRTNARIAGSTFLFYIAVGLTSMVLFRRASSGEGTAARLASLAQNTTTVGVTIVLTLLQFVSAVVLGVTLHALTRDEDRDLATLGMVFRVSEGVVGAIAPIRTLGLLSVASAATRASGPEAAAVQAVGALLLDAGWTGLIAGTCFALGSTAFSYLFLRARSIPVPLAWLGVVASVLLVVVLPLQLAGFLEGLVTLVVWLPMLVFEVTLALWLLIKGVRTASTARPLRVELA
jgi:Domain of unknown function (DUF4386)